MPLDMLTGPSALGSSSVESPFPEKSALYQVVKLTRIDAEEMRCEKLLYIALHPVKLAPRSSCYTDEREKKDDLVKHDTVPHPLYIRTGCLGLCSTSFITCKVSFSKQTQNCICFCCNCVSLIIFYSPMANLESH